MTPTKSVLLFLLALALIACAESSPAAVIAESGSTTTSSSVAPASDPVDTTTTEPPASIPTLDELQIIVDRTTDLPRTSFELLAISTLGGGSEENELRRTGSFDVDSLSGKGTLTISSTLSEAVLAEDPFEFRLLDREYWFSNPYQDPVRWTGEDVFELLDRLGGDPTGSMDSAGHLWLLMDAAIEVTGFEDDGAGTQQWLLNVRADTLLHSFSSGGAAQRIAAMGGAETGIVETLRVVVNDGLVTEADADLSNWWTEVTSLQFDDSSLQFDDGESALFRITVSSFDEPLVVERPCVDPTTASEDGIEYLVC